MQIPGMRMRTRNVGDADAISVNLSTFRLRLHHFSSTGYGIFREDESHLGNRHAQERHKVRHVLSPLYDLRVCEYANLSLM